MLFSSDHNLRSLAKVKPFNFAYFWSFMFYCSGSTSISPEGGAVHLTTWPESSRAEQSGGLVGKMAAAAVAEFQRAQSLLVTDRNASIDILHAIGKCDFQSRLL